MKMLMMAVFALVVVGCGVPNQVTASISKVDGGSWLTVCQNEDPIPRAVDDERSLCGTVSMSALKAGTYVLDGTAAYTNASDATTRSFTAGTSNDSKVLAAWATASCFAMPPTNPVTERLSGRLVLDADATDSVTGHLELTSTGGLAGPSCGWTLPARLSTSFKATLRP